MAYKVVATLAVFFFLALLEVNALDTHGRAKGVETKSAFDFLKGMAIQMMENNLDDDGNPIAKVEHFMIHAITARATAVFMLFALMVCPAFLKVIK